VDSTKQFCQNLESPLRGRVGQRNIDVHSQRERRYICHACQPTFTEFIFRR
jgi:transposase-like protein